MKLPSIFTRRTEKPITVAQAASVMAKAAKDKDRAPIRAQTNLMREAMGLEGRL